VGENGGQFDASVRFAAPTFAGIVLVTQNGDLQYVLMGLGGTANGTAPALVPVAAQHTHHAYEGAVFQETFVHGRALPNAGVPSPAFAARDIGDDAARGFAASRTYDDVTLGESFPGVEVRLHATGSNVEKIFTVAAHQDPGRIRLAIGG